MPNLTTPDSVLSGSGWMQELPATVGIVAGLLNSTDGGNTGYATLDTSSRYVICMQGVIDLYLTLPPANSVTAGFDLTILQAPNGPTVVYVDPNGNDLIEGTTSYQLTNAYTHLTVISDGLSSWWVVGQGGIYPGNIDLTGGLGVYNNPSPTTQPALCVTLADVIAVLVGCGLCASS